MNTKNSRILLYYPFGMGDHIICQGIVREYAKRYGHVTIFARDHNYPSVVFMYRDLPNLTIFHIDKPPLKVTEHSVTLNTPDQQKLSFDIVKIIGHNYLTWGENSIQFEKQLYDIAGISLLKKWGNFFVERNLKRERTLFEKAAPSGDYAFVHEDPERKYLIERNLINKDYKIFTPDPKLTDNIFDYGTIIEHAKEIHVIDSSFMFLVDCLPYENPNQKLFVHRYARDNNESLLPILKKDWTILVERHDKWEPVKDVLTALWFHRYYQKRRFSTIIFKIVRKIFWIMNWNMTRPKQPDVQALIQRYVPGRSFAEITAGNDSPDNEYQELAKNLEATSASIIDLSSTKNKPVNVVFCSKPLPEISDPLEFFSRLRSVTDEILIFKIPSTTKSSVPLIESMLIQSGFAVREKHLFPRETVFVCKTMPVKKTKLSIVTPVYNGEQYIAETIKSVLSQEGDFEIEYIIQDGGSTDGTGDIVRSFIDRINNEDYPLRCSKVSMQYFSEKDHGMYDAIEKGFAYTTGDIMAYINADDKYLPGAFATVTSVLSAYPEVEWVKGINTTANEQGVNINQGKCLLYRQSWLQKGVYGRSAYFVQQDSVFWKRSLWEKARPQIASLRLAGDYALWVAFAKDTPLWSLNKQVSVFRKRAGQLSAHMDAYREEQEHIAPHYPLLEKRVMLFFVSVRFLKLDSRSALTRALFHVLFPLSKQQWYIDFDPQGNPVKKKALSYIV